jgi:hypothetical protein
LTLLDLVLMSLRQLTVDLTAHLTLCLAENEAQSPWAPLHVEAGMAAGTSAVTVTRAESVINVTGGLAEIASVMGSAASGFGILWSGRPTVLIAPAVAADCARHGMSKDQG